jgi:hypothetical protein
MIGILIRALRGLGTAGAHGLADEIERDGLTAKRAEAVGEIAGEAIRKADEARTLAYRLLDQDRAADDLDEDYPGDRSDLRVFIANAVEDAYKQTIRRAASVGAAAKIAFEHMREG